MKSKRRIVAVVVVCFCVLLFWWRSGSNVAMHKSFPSSGAPISGPVPTSSRLTTIQSQESQDRSDSKRKVIEGVVNTLQTPITFYGKVVDQNGDAVSGAAINYVATDRFDASGSKYKQTSGDNGLFRIDGIRGASLTVRVRKEGYYPILNKSDGSFAYGLSPDETRRPPPTKDEPAVFILQKRGSTEPLIRTDAGQVDVPRSAAGIRMDLASGKIGEGDLRIESRVADSRRRPFDWAYRLSVIDGGLTEKQEKFGFEAPADGYTSSIEIAMPATAADWSSTISKEYFVKLKDGRYARCDIDFYAGDRTFVVMTSYLNPTPGNRNLEFDPAKQIAAGKK